MPDDLTPSDEPVAEADESTDLGDEEDFADVDTALSALDDRLDSALASLNARNSRVEEYLDQLKAERRRELQGTEADQLTFEDQAPTHDAQAADGGAA